MELLTILYIHIILFLIWILLNLFEDEIFQFIDNTVFYFHVFCCLMGYLFFNYKSCITQTKNGEIIKQIFIGK